MVLTSFVIVPLTASAKPANGIGVIRTGGDPTRLDGEQVNVCNDAEQSNTTAGIFSFDISDINIDANHAENAHLKFNWTHQDSAENNKADTRLFFYAVDSSKIADYVSSDGKDNLHSDWGYGSNQREDFMTRFDISEHDLIGVALPNADSADFDVTDLVNELRAGGSAALSVIIMRSTGNEGDVDGWTDCKFPFASQDLSYTVAESHYDIWDLEAAAKEFEAKLNDSNIYANIGNAYDAYILVNRYIDAWYYGNSPVSDSAANAAVLRLRAAINAMDPASFTANKYGSFEHDKNYLRVEDYAKTYKNVIWASEKIPVSTDEGENGQQTVASGTNHIYNGTFHDVYVNSQIYHPSAVLLYNGDDTFFPVIYRQWFKNTTAFGSTDYNHYATYISGQSNLYLNENWRGSGDTADTNWIWLHDGYTNNVSFTDQKTTSEYTSFSGTDAQRIYFLVNLLHFNGDGFFSENEYGKQIPTLTWGNRGSRGSASGDWVMTENGNYPIYVVDYSKVKAAAERAWNNIKNDISKYKDNELDSLIHSLDALTSINHQDVTKYNYADDTSAAVTALAKDLQNAVTNLEANTEPADVDYASLRKALSTAQPSYAQIQDMYNTHTWKSVNAFKAAYEAAQTHMASLAKNEYSTDPAEISALTTALNKAYNGLELRANLDEIRAVWHQGVELLEQLGKNAEPRYLQSDVQKLVEDLDDYAVYGSPVLGGDGPRDEFNIGISAQTAIDLACDILNRDIDALENGQVDMSAFSAAVDVAEKIDRDIYNENASPEALKHLEDVKGTPVSFSFTDHDHGSEVITGEVRVIKDESMSQDAINKLITDMITTLNENINNYKIAVPENVQVTMAGGSAVNDLNAVPYGTQLKFTYTGESEDVSWFMSFASKQAGRDEAYKTVEKEFTQEVIGDLKVTVKTRDDATPNLVKIIRDYGFDVGITSNYVDYVADNYEFELPEPTLISNYEFKGYKVGNEMKDVGDKITITKDTYIYAIFEYNADLYLVQIDDSNEGSYNKNYKFNEKLTITATDNADDGTVKECWIQIYQDKTGEEKARPFSPNKTVTFTVTEDMKLVATTREAYNAINAEGSVNLRTTGEFLYEDYADFYAQAVLPEGATLLEKGILIAKGTTPGIILDEKDITLGNIGKLENAVMLRSKSTKHTEAMQYSLRIRGDLRGAIYKGYLIYRDADGKTVKTIYSDAMTVGLK